MVLSQLFLLLICFFGAHGATFTLKNNCKRTIWPGILTDTTLCDTIMNGGFELKPEETKNITAPTGWSGRFWARDGCTFAPSGIGKCIIGDCGGTLKCVGGRGAPPVSLAEFVLDTPNGDIYDVSIVDGYNLPVSIVPLGGTGNCSTVSCFSDLNLRCPQELRIMSGGKVLACMSACLAFGTPEFCCTGNFNDPIVCQPSNYNKVFRDACPMAYSFTFDDAESTFTCIGANYLITFC